MQVVDMQGRWANRTSSVDMYVQNVTINVREAELKKVKEKGKEQPVWMTESTVAVSDAQPEEIKPDLCEYYEKWLKSPYISTVMVTGIGD